LNYRTEVIGYPSYAGNLIITDIERVAMHSRIQVGMSKLKLGNIYVSVSKLFAGKPTHVRNEDATNPFRHACYGCFEYFWE